MSQFRSVSMSVSRLQIAGFVAFFVLSQLLACDVIAQQESSSDQTNEKSSELQGEDQSLAEFREYAAKKMPSLTEAKIDLIVTRVDKNNDGKISQAEFSERVKIFRDVARGPEPWLEDLEAARALAKETGKPLLIYFRADWCLACKRFETDTLPQEAVQDEMKDFVRLRLVIDENPKAVEEFEVTAIPTLIVETQEGEAMRSTGIENQEKLIELLTESVDNKEPENQDQTR